MRAILLLMLGTAFADTCPLPELALPVAADPDPARTLEVLSALIVGSKNDSARDPDSVGRELQSLSEGDLRPIAAPVLPLLAVWRRLDCAALAGDPPSPKDWAALTDDARTLITKLTNVAPPAPPPPAPAAVYVPLPPPPAPPPPPIVLAEIPKLTLVDPRRRARGLLRVGYAFFAVSAGLMVIGTGVLLDGSLHGCGDCFLDFSPIEIGIGAATMVMGALALVGATSFMIGGHSEFRKLRLAPTASVGKDSGYVGLRGSF